MNVEMVRELSFFDKQGSERKIDGMYVCIYVYVETEGGEARQNVRGEG